MHFPHRADGFRAQQFDDSPIIVAGVNLRTHLRDELFAPGQFGDGAALGYCACQWLFAINVQSMVQPGGGCDGVGMIRSADDERIELFAPDHSSEIYIPAGTRKSASFVGEEVTVHVTQ